MPILGCGAGADGNDRVASDQNDAGTADTAPMTVGFWNVENLFDDDNDPLTDDDEFTPRGKMKWDAERLDAKLDALARGIEAIDEGRGPDAFGLAEVENRAVVERLVSEYLPSNEYDLVHAESPDGRGIDVALIYRRSLLKVLDVESHRIDLGNRSRPTRDILAVSFGLRGSDEERSLFTMLVNHWPSRSGGVASSDWKREAAASVAYRIVDDLLAADPAADIVLVGDFNDEPSDASIAEVLGAGRLEADRPLLNLALPVSRQDTIGTYLYKKRWDLLDQVIVSSGLRDDVGLRLLDTEMTIFHPDFLRDDHPSQPMRPPRRTYVRRTLYIGGTSDHFPVYARFLRPTSD